MNGEVIEQLFFNNTKLSREHGIRLLAGNLRRALFPELRSRQYDNVNSKSTSRLSYGRRYSYNTNKQCNLKGVTQITIRETQTTVR